MPETLGDESLSVFIMVDTNAFTKVVRGEVRSGVIRRRHWSPEEKGRIVAEAIAPGAVIAHVAGRYDLTPQHLGNWIRAARRGRLVLPSCEKPEETAPVFVPVVAVQSEAPSAAQIEIVAGTMVVRIPLCAEARTLEAVMRAIRRAAA